MACPNPFQYSALRPGDSRLLYILPESTPSDIRCRLSPFQAFPDGGTADAGVVDFKYIALSYAWRDPKPVASITVNGISFGVARNLHDCLTYLVGNTYEGIDVRCGLWIDAICINQQDDVEKSKQVQQMWRIYTNAVFVISWLGIGTPTTAVAMKILKDVEIRNETCSKITKTNIWSDLGDYTGAEYTDSEYLSGVIQTGKEYLQAFTSNGYFQRRWILQELACAKDIVLVEGKHSVAFDMLKLVFEIDLYDDEHHEHPCMWSSPLSDEVCQLLQMLTRFGCAASPSPWMDRPLSLAFRNLLDYCTFTKCSDPRDAVFALLSIPGARSWNLDPRIGQRIITDYTMTVEMVFIATIAYWDNLLVVDFVVDSASEPGLRYVEPWTSDEQAASNWLADVQILLHRLSTTLHLDYKADEFFDWLRKSSFHRTSEGFDAVQSRSGTLINCSGFILQDFLGQGPLTQWLRSREDAQQSERKVPLEIVRPFMRSVAELRSIFAA